MIALIYDVTCKIVSVHRYAFAFLLKRIYTCVKKTKLPRIVVRIIRFNVAHMLTHTHTHEYITKYNKV